MAYRKTWGWALTPAGHQALEEAETPVEERAYRITAAGEEALRKAESPCD